MIHVDFATFCHKGDAHRLHAPGQLKRQVESNGYLFDTLLIFYQFTSNLEGKKETFPFSDRNIKARRVEDYQIDTNNLDIILLDFNIDLTKPQYQSQTDKAHFWKPHVINHLSVILMTKADYIVFADNDCWMVRQPENKSWIERGIEILQERMGRRMSQQMFLARVNEFKNADFNQPGWDGNVDIPGGPMPEYWAMLEGRMELHCRQTGQYRYVLGPEYRYWHFNRLNEQDLFETDMSKY
jgi:hypothetical protein